MSETTPLEQRARQIADRMMADFPGLTRQKAKQKARPYAAAHLAGENIAKQWRMMADRLRPEIEKFYEAIRR